MIKKFGFALLVGTIIAIVCTYRWIHTVRFDPIYFKHFYDHSQWAIADSPRIMGDGELYQYAGYSLLTGADPFTINPEVPPVGKYMYAFAIKVFDNAYAFNVPLYVLAIILFWFWIKKMNLKESERYFATLLFAASPLVFAQIGDTGLDLLYLVTLLGFWLALSSKRLWLAGLILGVFISIKFGLFSLALISMTLVYLGWKNWKKYLPLFAISGMVYIASYAIFFIQGNSIWEWLTTQKWIVHFYASSEARKDPLVFLATIFAGVFKWENLWEAVEEWTLAWTFGAIALTSLLKQKESQLPIELTAYTKTLILIFLFVPFAVRYVLLILPILILALVLVMRNMKKSIVYGIVVVMLSQSVVYMSLSPNRAVERVNELLSTSRFNDLYSQLEIEGISRTELASAIHNFTHEIEADKVTFSVHLETDKLFSRTQKIRWVSSYETPLGPVMFQKSGFMHNINGRWLLDWDMEFVSPHFLPSRNIVLHKGNQVGGRLITKDEKVLSKGVYLPHISLLPEKIKDEALLLTSIKVLTGVDQLKSRTMIHVDYPSNLYKRIGFVKPAYDSELLSYVATQAGVLVSSENSPQTREYAKGAVNAKLVDEIQTIEEKYLNLKNYIQGKISIWENDVEYVIYMSPEITPSDIILNQNLIDIFGEGIETSF